MKYSKLTVLFSFTLLFFGCATAHTKALPVPQPPQLQHNRPPGFWENKQAVVQVKTITTVTLTFPDGSAAAFDVSGLGSGAVVDVNGVVITNNHVVALNVNELATMFGDFAQFISSIAPPVVKVCTVVKGVQYCGPAKVIATDPAHDLAKLYTHQRFPRAVKFVDNSELVARDELYFWGNVTFLLPLSPFSGNYIGRVEPPYTKSDIFTMLSPVLLVDSVSFPGSSGAPVFDALGRGIGLMVGSYPAQPGPRPVSIVIPSSTVMKFNEENPYPLPEK